MLLLCPQRDQITVSTPAVSRVGKIQCTRTRAANSFRVLISKARWTLCLESLGSRGFRVVR